MVQRSWGRQLMFPKYLLYQRTPPRGREEGPGPKKWGGSPMRGSKKGASLCFQYLCGSAIGSCLSPSHSCSILWATSTNILRQSWRPFAKFRGLGLDSARTAARTTVFILHSGPQAVTQGHLLVVEGWIVIEITGYQVLHMVLLFSAAKMVPSCRPRALGLQKTVYRHEHDND